MKYTYFIAIVLLLNTFFSFAQPGSGISCENAICLSSVNGDVFNNENIPPSAPLGFSCGVTHNNMFFSFRPEWNEVYFRITQMPCQDGNGIQAVIYETEDCVSFNELFCVSNGTQEPIDFIFSGEPGQSYMLMIDGFVGDVCDFIIVADGISDMQSPPPAPMLNVTSSSLEICLGESLSLQILNVDPSIVLYHWSISNRNSVVYTNLSKSWITLQGRSLGVSQVCAKVDDFCFKSETCIDIEVVSPLGQEIPDISTCSQYVDFCDPSLGFIPLLEDPSSYLDLSFHATRNEARNNNNPLACPYDLRNRSQVHIYARIVFDDCTVIDEFVIFHENVDLLDDITLGPFCQGPVILNDELTIDHLGDLLSSSRTFHHSGNGAFSDINELGQPVLMDDGEYEIWIRTFTDDGCLVVIPMTLRIGTQEIDPNFQVTGSFGGRYSVELSIQGPDAPYRMTWPDGHVGLAQNGLTLGRHTLIVSDIYGCDQELVYWLLPSAFGTDVVIVTEFDDEYETEIESLRGIQNHGFSLQNVVLYPNPAGINELIRISSAKQWETLDLYHLDGRIVKTLHLDNDQAFLFPSKLGQGLYLVRLHSENEKKMLKLLIK